MDEECWTKSLLLIENLANGCLRVVPETVERLRRIADPVRCISFNGPYRTGKSHLLNLLIAIVFKRDNVFPVGNTVEATTKGMWIWAGRHPRRGEDDDSWILFIDTEGLSDVQKGDNLNDLQSFILSLLLSSTFVYNSRGTIDYQALEQLHYVSTVAERIRLRSDSGEEEEDEEELGHDLIFPSFVWVVRDFHLERSIDGKELTDDGYLEKALQTKHDALNSGQLSVKRCLKEYFPSRRCFSLPRLVAVGLNGKDGEVGEDEEDGEGNIIDHRKLLLGIIDYILTSPLKIYEGSKITGKVFGGLAEAFVPAVLALEDVVGSLQPSRVCVEDIMTRVSDEENSKVLARCFEDYRASLNREAAEVRDVVELYRVNLDLLNATTMSFMTSAVHPINKHYLLLTEKIKMEFEELCTRKARELKATCADLWQRTKTETIGGIEQYVKVGGYKMFQDGVQKLKATCEMESIFQGNEGRCFLAEKLKELDENCGKLIMGADIAMTDLMKREEEKRLEDDRKREELKVTEAAKEEADEIAEKTRNFEERASTALKRTLDEKKETQLAFLEERIKTLERETEDLKRSGLKEEVENRQDRMEKYQMTMKVREQEAESIWPMVGAAAGQVFSSAVNTFMASFDPPPSVRRPFAALDRLLTKLGIQ